MTDEIRWLKVREVADRARCGPKTIDRAVRSGHLRAARIGGRRALRFLDSWIDRWVLGQDNEGLEPYQVAARQANAGIERATSDTGLLPR
jgi:excisionase family DNA binding protein